MLYLDYYGLKEKPFHGSANPNYFWLGEGQSEAISILNYGIETGDGITVLTGDIGTGKTTLVKFLARHHNHEFKIANIDDSNIESADFLYFIADSLNLPHSFDDKKSFFKYVEEEYSKTKKRMLIILDEAHRSTKSLLGDLDLMAKIKRGKKPLINLVLVGQKSLIELIKELPRYDIKQKAPIICYLRSLTKSETNEYIKHRLKIAGTKRKLFSPRAIGKIFQYAGGIPRVINTICDHALMIGYSTDLKEIKSFVIKECAEDLLIENYAPDNTKHSHSQDYGFAKQQY